MVVFRWTICRAKPNELEASGTVCYRAKRKSGSSFMVWSLSGFWRSAWGVEGLNVSRRGVWVWGLGLLDISTQIQFSLLQSI